jgi:hypothetical protein
MSKENIEEDTVEAEVEAEVELEGEGNTEEETAMVEINHRLRSNSIAAPQLPLYSIESTTATLALHEDCRQNEFHNQQQPEKSLIHDGNSNIMPLNEAPGPEDEIILNPHPRQIQYPHSSQQLQDSPQSGAGSAENQSHSSADSITDDQRKRRKIRFKRPLATREPEISEQVIYDWTENTNFYDAGFQKIYFALTVMLLTIANYGYGPRFLENLKDMESFQTDMNSGLSFDETIDNLYYLRNADKIGFLIGGLFVTNLLWRYGCILTIKVGALFAILGIIFEVSVGSFWIFLVGRVLIGVSLMVTSVAAPIYAVEISHPQFRGWALGFYNSGWNIGEIPANIVCFSKLLFFFVCHGINLNILPRSCQKYGLHQYTQLENHVLVPNHLSSNYLHMPLFSSGITTLAPI